MKRQLLERPGPLTGRPLRASVTDDLVAGPGEIAIDVAACGVCRTDLQIVEGDLAARMLPIVPGHQIVGTVRNIGEGVTGWSVGDRVGAGWLGGACGTCEYCTSGRENLCADAVFNGWDRNGG